MIQREFKNWISLEEHSVIGGLGSALIEWASDNSKEEKVKVKRLGAKDSFIHELGNQAYTRSKLGIDSKGIVNFIKGL